MIILLNGVEKEKVINRGVHLNFGELMAVKSNEIDLCGEKSYIDGWAKTMVFFLKLFTKKYPNVNFVVDQMVLSNVLAMLKADDMDFKCYTWGQEEIDRYLEETKMLGVELASDELINVEETTEYKIEDDSYVVAEEVEDSALKEWEELVENFRKFNTGLESKYKEQSHNKKEWVVYDGLMIFRRKDILIERLGCVGKEVVKRDDWDELIKLAHLVIMEAGLLYSEYSKLENREDFVMTEELLYGDELMERILAEDNLTFFKTNEKIMKLGYREVGRLTCEDICKEYIKDTLPLMLSLLKEGSRYINKIVEPDMTDEMLIKLLCYAYKSLLEKKVQFLEEERNRNNIAAVLTWKHDEKINYYMTVDKAHLKTAYSMLEEQKEEITAVQLYSLKQSRGEYSEYCIDGLNAKQLL